MTISVGFTGTRKGMIEPQRVAMYQLLSTSLMNEFHHGDCVGADAQAHEYVQALNPAVRIYVHPPTNDSNRAFKKGHVLVAPYSYLIRNTHIVQSSYLMLAAPKGMTEDVRSGTWHAIRYAAKQKVRTIIVWPDGRVEERAY